VLSHDEQRAWDEIRRRYAEEAEEPAGPVLDPTIRRPRSSEPAGVTVAVVVASRVAVLLLLFGALSVGLAIAVATAFGWLLWRYRRLLGGGQAARTVGAPRRPPRRCGAPVVAVGGAAAPAHPGDGVTVVDAASSSLCGR
jgi:hypothetical protein